jgi:hypothetical protein
MKWNPGSGNNQSSKPFFMRKTFGQESLQLWWGRVILVALYTCYLCNRIVALKSGIVISSRFGVHWGKWKMFSRAVARMWPAFVTGAGRIEVSRRIVPASLEEPQVPSGGNRKSEEGKCDAAGLAL